MSNVFEIPATTPEPQPRPRRKRRLRGPAVRNLVRVELTHANRNNVRLAAREMRGRHPDLALPKDLEAVIEKILLLERLRQLDPEFGNFLDR